MEWSLNQLSFVHIWINGEFSRITVNYPKLHNHYAAVILSNSRRLQTSTKQGKNEFAKCPHPKTKKAIFSFSIQSNSKVYPVPIANMFFSTNPSFLQSKVWLKLTKGLIQNMMNSLVEPISNQHKPFLFLAKIHSVQYKPNFVKQRVIQIQTKPIDHIILH